MAAGGDRYRWIPWVISGLGALAVVLLFVFKTNIGAETDHSLMRGETKSLLEVHTDKAAHREQLMWNKQIEQVIVDLKDSAKEQRHNLRQIAKAVGARGIRGEDDERTE